MQRNGVPNDIITNLNPISLVIFIPIVDNFLYPALRKAGIKFTPIKRMAFGFLLASLAMVGAAVIQVGLTPSPLRSAPLTVTALRLQDRPMRQIHELM